MNLPPGFGEQQLKSHVLPDGTMVCVNCDCVTDEHESSLCEDCREECCPHCGGCRTRWIPKSDWRKCRDCGKTYSP